MTIRDHLISKKNAEARLVDQMKNDGGPGSGPRAGKGKYAKLAQAASEKAEKSGKPMDHQMAAISHRFAAADETDRDVSLYHTKKAEHHAQFV
jgi:hypothetical protein